jgi:transcriptional regulator with XRE-family HTH domain
MPPIESKELGDLVRKMRRERGMSLRAVADASGLDWSYIGRLEKGEIGTPDPAKLQKLARGLAVEVEDFYALAGYLVPEGLPGLAPYLRVKYDLPEEAMTDVERYVARLKKRYPEPPKAKKTARRKR